MTLLRRLIRKATSVCFNRFEALGFHVVPIVYDSPVPQTKDLTDDVFQRESECVGLDWNTAVQEEYLSHVFPSYAEEVEFEESETLSLVDSAILHSMIRHYKPRKIVEIGSGASTQVAARACELNRREGNPYELVSIDPYPRKDVLGNVPGKSTLIETEVQSVDLAEITDCDLLFIDSTHVVKIGGDVNFEILEIVPRLKPGALVHWHDMLLPGEYWKEWVKEKHYIWTEQYMVHAFLKFNSEFEVLWGSRYMHLKDATAIKSTFPFFQPGQHHISSLWVRRRPESL